LRSLSPRDQARPAAREAETMTQESPARSRVSTIRMTCVLSAALDRVQDFGRTRIGNEAKRPFQNGCRGAASCGSHEFHSRTVAIYSSKDSPGFATFLSPFPTSLNNARSVRQQQSARLDSSTTAADSCSVMGLTPPRGFSSCCSRPVEATMPVEETRWQKTASRCEGELRLICNSLSK
jgi:hypothetical protein